MSIISLSLTHPQKERGHHSTHRSQSPHRNSHRATTSSRSQTSHTHHTSSSSGSSHRHQRPSSASGASSGGSSTGSSGRLKTSQTSRPPGDEVYVGKYKLLKTIGKGNFAKVKLAKHMPTGQEVGRVFTVGNSSVDIREQLSLLSH